MYIYIYIYSAIRNLTKQHYDGNTKTLDKLVPLSLAVMEYGKVYNRFLFSYL